MIDVLWGVGGMTALLLIAVLCSSDRRAIRPRTVLAALLLEVGFGILVLSWSVGGRALEATSSGVQAVIDSSGEGIGFLFGPVLNEFVAFADFGPVAGEYSEKTAAIITFALTGFANLGSLGILLGGLGGIAPERRGDIASLGLRAILAATLANLMSAAIAGILIG